MGLRDLLLILIVLCTLPMAFVRPMVGLWLWIGFSFMNPHRLTWGFASTLPWVQIVAIVTLCSLLINREQRQAIPWKPVTVLLVTFLVWTAITSVSAVMGDAAWVRWETLLKAMMLGFVTLVLAIDSKRLHAVVWAIVLSFGFWGVKSGVFTILTGGSHHIFGPNDSFFQDNNAFALVMCMALPLMRYLQLQAPNRWVNRGMWLMMLLTVASIIGTYSRGGLIGLAAVALMLALKSRHRLPLIAVGVVLVMGALAFMPQKWVGRMATISEYQEQGSVVSRLNSWQFATNVALANPLTGGGFGVSGSTEMWSRYGPPGSRIRAVHSIYFRVLGEQGFVGLFLYLLLFIGAFNALRRIKKRTRADTNLYWMSDLAAMLQVSLVGYMVAGAALPNPYFELFFEILAVVVVLQVQMERALSNQRQTSTQATQEIAQPQSIGQTPGKSASDKWSSRPVTSRIPHW